jgi:hypothetical protein
MKQLMTFSRQDCFKSCRRKHYYAYELALRRTTDAKALRMGSNFHQGVEILGKGGTLEAACDAVRAKYDRPDVFDPYEWEIERETVLRLVCAYQWRWESHRLEYLAVEQSFELPLLNPKTGKRTTSFNLAGKIDGIVRMEDGRIAVKETKLFGDDIGNDAPLWRRLRMDQQISLYMHASRRIGFDVDAVLYDVARKPTIGPTAIALTDELGAKIVLDKHGDRVRTERGQYRQTGDKEKGYTLQTRQMTADEWGDKLSSDIAERPDFYFQRQEVPRLEQDLEEYQRELWQIQQDVRNAQKNGLWYRTVNKQVCGFCSYFDLCSSGKQVGTVAPDGFEFLKDMHPELTGDPTNERSSTTETTTTEASTASGGEGYW